MTKFMPGRSYVMNNGLSEDFFTENHIEPIDRLVVDLGALGVKELREVLSLAGEKPLGETRLLWLKNAEDLSDIIQNTLLKIIEEPPNYLIIILQAQSSEDLLPTLRSRLHRVKEEVAGAEASSIFPAERVDLEKLLTSMKDRKTLTNCLNDELGALGDVMLFSPSRQISRRIELLHRSIRRLKQNCNQKLVTDNLLLHWFGQ